MCSKTGTRYYRKAVDSIQISIHISKNVVAVFVSGL